MKIVSSALAHITLVLLSGCGGESTPVFRDAGPINCSIEIQIAVRSQPYRKGDGMNEGDFLVVSSNIFPIHSTGGPGHVVCNSDGVVMEIKWDEVQLLESRMNQHHSFEKTISFDNFRLQIHNQIVRPDGVSHSFHGSPNSLALSTEFGLIQTPLAFSSSAEKKERALIIRARLLPKAKPAKSLTIPQTPEFATEIAGSSDSRPKRTLAYESI